MILSFENTVFPATIVDIGTPVHVQPANGVFRPLEWNVPGSIVSVAFKSISVMSAWAP